MKLSNLTAFIATLVISFGVMSVLQPDAPVQVGATLPQTPAVFETSLQSPISSSATTMTLTANSIRGGGSVSGYTCFTVDEGNTNAETICGTVSGTTVSNLERGISQATGTTTVASLQFSHRRGANVKITNFPIIQLVKAQNSGEETFANLLAYATTTPTATAPTHITSKAYVDSVANQGAATSTETNGGIVELATKAEQAASTDGGANTPRVLYSKYSTSTPDGTSQAGQYTVVSEADGKLNQLWLDLTEGFNFTGTFGISTSTPWGNIGINHGAGEIPFAIGSSTATSLVVNADGKLGLGTTTPSLRLSVVGGALFDSSGITFNDGTTQTTAAKTYTCVVDTYTRSSGAGTGSQTFPHTLGVTPNYIRIDTMWAEAGGLNASAHSIGIATSTAGQRVQNMADSIGSVPVVTQNTSNIIRVLDEGNNNMGTAALSFVDATSTAVNWTTAADSNGLYLLVEICGNN